MEIKYIKYKDIDFAKWDARVEKSLTGNVAGFSWFLDVLYGEWDCLVFSDYEIIMPIPVKKSFNFLYIKQSPFVIKTSIYSAIPVDKKVLNRFIKSIPSKINFVDFDIENYYCDNQNLKLSEKIVYQMDLISKYDNIYERYTSETKEALKKLKIDNYSYVAGVTLNELISLIHKTDKRSKKTISKIRLFAATVMRHKLGKIYAAYDKYNNISSAIIAVSSHFKTNIISVFYDKKNDGELSVTGLIDYYIRLNTEIAYTLIFPSLKIRNKHNFYIGFGASKKILCNVKFKNRHVLKRFVRNVFCDKHITF